MLPAFTHKLYKIVSNKTFKKRIDLLKALFDTIFHLRDTPIVFIVLSNLL
ncbi:MAG: hypothetical protein HPY66_2070 [Firmicutes bacterium]|nr:hypothetical protein [Bacillota bacterium]